MSRLPLRWQIPILYAVIMAVVLIAGGLLLYRQQADYLYADAAARLRDQARQVMDRRGGPPPGGPERGRSAFGDLADELAARDVGAAIYAFDGTIVATTTRGIALPYPAAAIAAARAGQDQLFVTSTDTGRVLWVLVPLRGQGPDTGGVVQLGMSSAQIDESLNRLAVLLALGIAAVLIVATALGVTVTRRALRPLQRVVDTTHEIAAGDLSRRVGMNGSNEVGQLAQSFDAMVARLEDAFAAQRRFVADAAHELRTPLTALSGSVELLRMGAVEDDPQQAAQLLKHLDVELSRVIRLTNDLLTLSALDAQPRLALDPIDLSALLEDLAGRYAALLAAHDFRAEIAPGLRVMANEDRLRQVVINLLDNARKNTPPGKVVALRAGREGDVACIEVRDEGVGIAVDALPHLFDRFYRVDDARGRAQGGSGLGLAIAKAIVDAHGGTIEATSEPGAGSRFIVRLGIA